MPPRRLRTSAPLVVALVAACADLPVVPRGVCGNGIVEPGAGEECDLVATHAGGVCRAPGEAYECRHDCAPGADGVAASCAAGQRCGVDGVCRRPSGRFAPARDLDTASPIEVLVADLDGDGRDDVVSFEARAAEVRFLGEGGRVSERRSVPARRVAGALPRAIRFGPGEPESLALSFESGVLFALGGADRELPMTGHALPLSEVVAMRLGTVQLFTPEGPEQAVVAAADLGGVRGMVVVRTDYTYTIIGALPRSPDELVDLPAADLIDDPAHPCEEVVPAFAGSTALEALSPCVAGSDGRPVAAPAAPRKLVGLAGGATLTGPIWLSDLDGDANADIVLVAERDGEREIHVAHGDGAGSFSEVPSGPTTGVTRASASLEPGQIPLCVGDVDRDGAVDFADERGVVLGRSSGWVRAATGLPVSWGLARFADVNADGLVDVIGASRSSAMVQVHLGTGTGAFSAGAIGVPNMPSAIELSDLDGDFVTDIVVLSPGARVGEDVLSVAFGAAGGFPGAPVLLGVLDEVAQVYGRPSATPVPPRGLSVLSRTPRGVLQLTAFASSSDRVVRAPANLLASSSDDPEAFHLEAYATTRLAVVRRGDEQGVIALGEDAFGAERFRLFPLPLTGRGRIDLQNAVSSAYLPSITDWASSFFVALDVERDGTDEVVAIGPAGDGSSSLLHVVRALASDAGLVEYALGTALELGVRVDHVQAVGAASGAPQGGRALAFDVDRDGRDDVVFSATRGDGAPVVAIAWNDGGFGGLETVPLAAPADGLATAGIDGRGTPALIVLSGGALFLLSGGGRTPRAEPLSGATGAGATLLASGDLDGDGVDDLVLGSASRLRLVRGIPALE